MLTWHDYPADLNAPTQLVNDLDLVVRLELPAATVTAGAATAATTANGTTAIEGRGTKSTNPTGSSGNSTGGSSSQQQEPLLQPLTHFLGNNHEDEGEWRHGLPCECVPYQSSWESHQRTRAGANPEHCKLLLTSSHRTPPPASHVPSCRDTTSTPFSLDQGLE